MKFYFSSNNGVSAVISEEHAARYGVVKKSGGDPVAAGCKVFTFCSKERMERDVVERRVFTGTDEDLEVLIKAGGHTLGRGAGHTSWDGYVPFSNGHQYIDGEDEGKKREMRYATTLRDVMDVFGFPMGDSWRLK